MSDKPETSPRPWHTEQPGDECRFWTIRNPDGISVCTAWREADAALIVDAVNERAKFEEARMEFQDFRPVIIAAGQRDAAISERDRLRALVRRLITIRENIFWRKDERTGLLYYDTTIDEDEARRTIEEARAAIEEAAK